MSARVVQRRRKGGGITNSKLREWLNQWITLDTSVKDLGRRKDELRDRLMAAVEEHGTEDQDGHQWLPLDEPVEGVSQLKREKRVSRNLDNDKTMDLLKEKGLVNECVDYVPVINEDNLYKQVYAGKISAEELEALVVERVTYAFKPGR